MVRKESEQILDRIKSKVNSYFPEVDLSDVTIRNRGRPREYLRSRIYELGLIDKEGKTLRSIIVKVRKNHPDYNNLVSETAKDEFETLRFLWSKFNSTSKTYTTVRPLDYFPETAALVTEKVAGISLRSLLLRNSLPLVKNLRKDYLLSSVRRAGEWLSLFHKITDTGKKGQINIGQVLASAKHRLDSCCEFGLEGNLASSVLSYMEKLAPEVSKQYFNIAHKHGDYQINNVIISDEKTIALDISSLKKDIVIKDACCFLRSLYLMNLKSYYPSYNQDFAMSLEREYFYGYFGHDGYPRSSLIFNRLLGLIESLQRMCYRRSPLLRRLRIIPFYSFRLKELIGQK